MYANNFSGQNFRNQMNQMGNTPQNVADWGAHEILMTHEVLTDCIDGINQFELYRPHVRDQRLLNILDNQINHSFNGYNKLVNYLHQRGASQAVPYRVPQSRRPQYGLRNPSPETPNLDMDQMNDRDVASGMLGCAKASASLATIAALECSDATLRNMLTNCAVSNINMAYETFQYLNEKGYYQVPTMQNNTTQTIIDTYQPANAPQMMNRTMQYQTR